MHIMRPITANKIINVIRTFINEVALVDGLS